MNFKAVLQIGPMPNDYADRSGCDGSRSGGQSGFCDFPLASDLLRELGFEFIQKPFTPTELADKVKSILS